MKEPNEIKKQLIVLLLSLLLSVLTVVIPDWAKLNFNKADEIFLGVMLFISFLLIDVFWMVTKYADREKKEEQKAVLRDHFDKTLASIRTCFSHISGVSYGTKDLFVTHFVKQVHDLELKIREVAERQELRLRADHFLNLDNVLDAFQGDPDRIWRYTWLIDSKHRLFDHNWKRYFDRTASMLEKGEIKQARSLLVLDDMKLLTSPRVAKLLDFYHTHKGMECWVISRSDYLEICADSGVPASYLDFGIYGTRLLFLTEQYEPEIIGVFTKEPKAVEHYRLFFDSMWGTPSVAKRNPSGATGAVSLEDVFALDEKEPALLQQ